MSSAPAFDWDPAGPDRALAVARGDVAALRLGATREVLAETRLRGDFDARAFRSLVLAAAAASNDVVETWAQEEPENPDALLLYARLTAHRAVTAKRNREALSDIAVKACAAAHRAWPQDPTPFVVELTLLRMRQPYGRPAPGHAPGSPVDPAWALWRETESRHAGNREAGQRLLALCYPRHGGTVELASDTAAYLASVATADSISQLLPLLARLEQSQGADQPGIDPTRLTKIQELLDNLAARASVEPQAEQRRRTLLEMLDLELRGEQPGGDPLAETLGREWFGPFGRPPVSATVSDLSVLAEALHRSGRLAPAWRVLQHLHPYASPFPWSRHGPPEQVLARVYRDCRRG